MSLMVQPFDSAKRQKEKSQHFYVKKEQIMLLISKEDVYNYLNIDLNSFLGVQGQPNATLVISSWLSDRQDEIVSCIADFAYGGRKEALARISTPDIAAQTALKRAILAQCKYVYDNGEQGQVGGIMLGQGGSTSKLSIDERLDAQISPKAYQILSNAGFLYSGRLR